MKKFWLQPVGLWEAAAALLIIYAALALSLPLPFSFYLPWTHHPFPPPLELREEGDAPVDEKEIGFTNRQDLVIAMQKQTAAIEKATAQQKANIESAKTLVDQTEAAARRTLEYAGYIEAGILGCAIILWRVLMGGKK